MIAVQEDIQTVWKKYKTNPNNIEMRNRLIEHYMPLVHYNANRIWQKLPDNVELDDLVSSGVFGLMNAIDVFDTSRGIKFETFCVLRIRGAMLDELRYMDWVPRLVRVKASQLAKARKQLESRYGRIPTDIELAELMQVSVQEVEKLREDASAVHVVSLNRKWFETDTNKEVSEVHILTDKKGEDPTLRIQKSELLRSITRGLNRVERMIVILYYYEELTMKEIGITLGRSESRISQIHSALLERLRQQQKGKVSA